MGFTLFKMHKFYHELNEYMCDMRTVFSFSLAFLSPRVSRPACTRHSDICTAHLCPVICAPLRVHFPLPHWGRSPTPCSVVFPYEQLFEPTINYAFDTLNVLCDRFWGRDGTCSRFLDLELRLEFERAIIEWILFGLRLKDCIDKLIT